MDEVTLKIPKSLLVIATVILVGGALGFVGFFLGRDSAGATDTEQVSTEAKAEAREAGYDEGFAAGKKAAEPERTYQQGLVEGRGDGYDKGYREGGQEALDLAQFDFSTGNFYIVQFADRGERLGLQIQTAVDLLAGRSYVICNTNDLCFR